ncbi:type IIL restriction-modification enzyme MmeI, partial [Vibrio parahaemolyticus]
TWVKSVAGRMRTDIRYTSGVCYNSFPLPELDASNKDELLRLSMDILEARELFPEKNISDLYDPIKMP